MFSLHLSFFQISQSLSLSLPLSTSLSLPPKFLSFPFLTRYLINPEQFLWNVWKLCLFEELAQSHFFSHCTHNLLVAGLVRHSKLRGWEGAVQVVVWGADQKPGCVVGVCRGTINHILESPAGKQHVMFTSSISDYHEARTAWTWGIAVLSGCHVIAGSNKPWYMCIALEAQGKTQLSVTRVMPMYLINTFVIIISCLNSL